MAVRATCPSRSKPLLRGYFSGFTCLASAEALKEVEDHVEDLTLDVYRGSPPRAAQQRASRICGCMTCHSASDKSDG